MCFRISIERCLEQQSVAPFVDSFASVIFALHAIHRARSFRLITDRSIAFSAKGDNCEYAYTFNKCYAEASPRVSTYASSFFLLSCNFFKQSSSCYRPIIFSNGSTGSFDTEGKRNQRKKENAARKAYLIK